MASYPPPFVDFGGHLPSVSVLCPTYGRTSRLPGLLESFRRQDYAGAHELIILNDRGDQLIFAADIGKPVTTINEATQASTLGAKRNALLDLAHYEYVAWWDDDDRYLPNHLTKQLSIIREGFRGSIQSHVWLDEGGDVPSLHRPWSPFGTAITERSAILDVGGFPNKQMHEDNVLAMKLVHEKRAFWAEHDTGAPTFIYRRPGTSEHTHVCEFPTKDDNEGALAFMRDSVDLRVRLGKERTGQILVNPAWERDYVSWCATAWANEGRT